MSESLYRKTGAKLSPRAALAAATPFRPEFLPPDNVIYLPAKLSYWLNNQYGDCVTAEEAFAKACHTPEIFIQDAEVQRWASKNGVLEGADLSSVLDAMKASGFQQDGKYYNDGDKQTVDWTNAVALQGAIATGPVKIAVASGQFGEVVKQSNGWFGVGWQRDDAIDHCVCLCGYGTIAWLAQQLGVQVPTGIDGTKPGYACFTWDTVGILDVPSMLNVTQEAWVRIPTTVVIPPDPTPPTPPTPIPPGPGPVPTPPGPQPWVIPWAAIFAFIKQLIALLGKDAVPAIESWLATLSLPAWVLPILDALIEALLGSNGIKLDPVRCKVR